MRCCHWLTRHSIYHLPATVSSWAPACSCDILAGTDVWRLCRASTLRRREERKRKREEQEAAEKATAAEKDKADRAQKGTVEAAVEAPGDPAGAEDGNGPAKRAKVEAVEDAAHVVNGSAAADGTAAQEAAVATGSKPESENAEEQLAHKDPAAAEAVKAEDGAVPLKTTTGAIGAEPGPETLAAGAPDVKMAEAEPRVAPDSAAPEQAIADANGAYLLGEQFVSAACGAYGGCWVPGLDPDALR